MGLHALLKTAEKTGENPMDYMQAFCQLGHSIILGVLLMMLIIWISRRTAKLQGRSKDKKDGSNESVQGGMNVLFFCFGMTGVMILVDDNIARAFAIGAAIALVRFRIKMGNSMLSTAFLFSVVIGMACGVGNLPIAWSMALLYALVTICLSIVLGWRSSVNARPVTGADTMPGQLTRNVEGGWRCQFPRYTATIDGVTGDLISLLVKGDELIRRTEKQPTRAARDGEVSATSVAEFDSPYRGRSGVVVSDPSFSLRWHFLPDTIVIDYKAESGGACETMLFFSRMLGPLSPAYPARSRHLSDVAWQAGVTIGEVGVSAVTRGGTPIVFHAPNPRAIAAGHGKRAHGITLGGAVEKHWAAEIQIGPSTASMPLPDDL